MQKEAAGTLRLLDFDAVLFDLDGVVTRTAEVHAAAWKKLFDAYLRERAGREGGEYRPFDIDKDYRRHLDGKPRYEGVRDFLASRGIELPGGDPDDPPEKETVCGLGNRKNEFFRRHLKKEGVEVYETTVDFIRRLRAAGIRTAVFSASRNGRAVLARAGLENLFDVRIDGLDAARLGLRGKPSPDVLLAAARRLGVEPERAAVVEDALAGVQAARRGGFGRTIAIDRSGSGETLRKEGADIVVKDLSKMVLEGQVDTAALPSALERLGEIGDLLVGRRPAVFLDYDGTLTPIVRRPEEALLSAKMRRAVLELANRCPVAVISGRDRRDVQEKVGIGGLAYAGSHGFDIAGPGGEEIEHQAGRDFLPDLDAAEGELRQRLGGVEGAQVERKRFAIAVHYRRVAEEEVPAVEQAVNEVLAAHGNLRKTGGKKIFELRPGIDWDKGKAVAWLLERLGLDRPEVLPVYLGDDETDEDAFRELSGRGLGIVVRDEPRPTAARYALEDPGEVGRFLGRLAQMLAERSG